MSPLVIAYPVIDPVAFEIGPIAVRWYGLAYMSGLLLGWLYIRSMLKNRSLWPGKPPLEPHMTDDLLLWTTLGVVIGGRLGNVLLYDPGYYFANPLEIFAIWKGGMAFHGGLLGVILAVYLFSRAKGVRMFTIADLCCAAAPIGIFFGRLANFINQEVVGRVTDVSWAMVFPAVDSLPRHPSQLYEAVLEGVLVFILCRWVTHRAKLLDRPGVATGVFFVGYGVCRIIAENFRTFDPTHALAGTYFTPSMVYSVPMILVGAYVIWRAYREPVATA